MLANSIYIVVVLSFGVTLLNNSRRKVTKIIDNVQTIHQKNANFVSVLNVSTQIQAVGDGLWGRSEMVSDVVRDGL